MLRIKLEQNTDGEIQVKLLPESAEEIRRVEAILNEIDIENPIITYMENQTEDNPAKVDVNSLEYYCGKSGWTTKNDMMYSTVNALVVLQNLLTCLIQQKRENKKLEENAFNKKVYFTPCFDFEDDAIELFSLGYTLEFDKMVLTECMIECNHIFTCGEELTDKEQKFVEMIWKGQEQVSVWELIKILMEMLWEYYNNT